MANRHRQIGIFDSGIGGLGLLREMLEQSQERLHFDYIADDAYSPYGKLDFESIIERAHELSERLIERGAELVVLACNTATAVAIDSLREKHPGFPFVGVEPYLNVLSREPELLGKDYQCAVITTEAMGKSQRFERLRQRLDPEKKIDHHCCPELATLIDGMDEQWSGRLEKELEFLSSGGYRQVILGCTHYSLIEDYFRQHLNIRPIGPERYVARRVFDLLGLEFISSCREVQGEKTQTLWFESTARDRREEFSPQDFPLNLLTNAINQLVDKK